MDTASETIDIHSLNCCALSEAPVRFNFTPEACFQSHDEPGPAKTWEIHEDIVNNSGECQCVDCGGDGVDAEGDDCELCDGDGYLDMDDGDPDAWFPKINLAYPIPHLELPDDWRSHLVNMTVVNIFDEPHLALTGGGMDMRWAIAETYINLGYYPPADVCKLPSMGSRGESERDQLILKACFIALEKMRQRAQWQLDSLDDQYAISWSREDYERRGEIEA